MASFTFGLNLIEKTVNIRFITSSFPSKICKHLQSKGQALYWVIFQE